MTFPTQSGVQRSRANSPVTTRNIPLPTGVTAGDLLVVFFTNNGVSAVTWDDATAGVWTLLHTTEEATLATHRHSVYWKVADGSESGLTLSVATAAAQRSVTHAYCFQNATSIEYVDSANQGQTGLPNPPALTPAGGAADTLWMIALALRGTNRSGVIAVPPSPASIWQATDLWDTNDNTSGVGLLTANYALNASTLDPATINTMGNSRVIVGTYAIRSGSQPIQLPAIASTLAFHALTIAPLADVVLPLIASTAQFHELRVIADQVVELDLFANANTFHALSIVTSEVGLPHIASTETFYPLTVSVGETPIQLPLIASTATFYPLLVTGGDRTAPVFTDIEVGPFAGAVGDLAIYSGSSQGAAFQQRWATRGPIGFGDYNPFVAGEYEFTAASIWLHLAVEPVERVFAITRAKMNVDVPDVIDSQEVEIPEGGAWVAFARNFYQPPTVVAQVITAAAVTTVPRATVRDDIEKTRCFVILHFGDDTTDSVVGRAKIIATGY